MSVAAAGCIVGVDVGGTFTDGLLIAPATGELRSAKVPTTPEDQSRGTLETLPGLDISASDMALFCHGTTAGINAFLQRNGAKIGLICTEGTRDLLDVGQFTREPSGLYDPHWLRPHQAQPIVQRRHIREISARRLYDGSVHVALDEDEVRAQLEFLRDEGIEALGICLMHAYVDLADEERVQALAEEIMPGCYIQTSGIRPVVGEYTRTTAVVLDAYTGPVVSTYLRRLEDRLRGAGYDGAAVVMQMNGGVKTLERTVEDFPAYTMLSGPVAGMLGAEYFARNFLGVDNLVCIDIGGTSTDLGLVIGGVADTVPEWEAEWRLTLGMPAVDVRSIGAGGGSIIQTDELGTLRVGPESAGAQPGPISYGRGGTQPTVTDAHAIVGTLRPETFWGGKLTLLVDDARRGFDALAESVHMPVERLAAGALQLVNAQIESEIAKMVFERGVDVRDFSLFAYGGAGALHAVEVARSAGISEVIVPRLAGGFSALGLATAPPKAQRAVSRIGPLQRFTPRQLTEAFDDLEAVVVDDLVSQGVAPEGITVTRSLAAMYTGQGFSNEVPLHAWPPTDAVLEEWRTSFDELYDRLYGYTAPEMEVTLTTLTLSAEGQRPELRLPEVGVGTTKPDAAAFDGVRTVNPDGIEPVQARFYRRELLLAGNELEGPAVVEDDMTTIWIPPRSCARVDSYGNLRIEVRS